MNIKELDKEFVANTYARADVLFTSGKGAEVYDDTGKRYIDLGAGIAVNVFGCADETWIGAVTKQLNKLQHMSNLYYTEPCVKLAEMLCERTGMKRVFFGNSGAEANECAIKTARKWAFDKYGDYSHGAIITLKNSFHGRTITTLAATGQDAFHTKFAPFTPGFVYASAQDAAEVRELAERGDCCAVMMELCQGEGGVIALEHDYVDQVVEIAREHDLLIIIDEVQTGNGRTGTLYAFQQYGFMPDIVSTAKGLGGGLPLGACMLGERVKDTLDAGSHGSTFGGNPVCCAGAISIISRLDDAFLAEVNEKAAYVRGELAGTKGVKSVSGLGLMIGLECEKPVSDVLNGALRRGVIVLSAHSKVRLVPPLSITMEQLSEAVKILKEVIAE
ncbi:MAG: acetylornithine/succinylornithine family transaminase [Oscillospiraceae bacterium]